MLGQRVVLLNDPQFSGYLIQAGYQVALASPQEALELLRKEDAQFLVDWRLGGKKPEFFCVGLVSSAEALARALAEIYVAGPALVDSPIEGVQLMARRMQSREAEEKSLRESRQTEESVFQVLAQISRAIENRSRYFEGYGVKLEKLVTGLGRAVGLSRERMGVLGCAASLHGLGMIHVPEEVLHKSGQLSAEERPLIQSHVTRVRKILSPFPPLLPVSNVLVAHHEWYNGEGYPTGLAGNEILVESRILGLAEAYLSLSSSRPHRQALSHEPAMNVLKLASGLQFDPELVSILPAALKEVEIEKTFLKPPSEVGIVALCGLLHMSERYSEAIGIWEEAKNALEPKGKLRILGQIWISQCYWALGQLQGIELAKKAVGECQGAGSTLLLGHALLNLASLELSRQRAAEARDLLVMSLDLLEKEEDHYASTLAAWALSRIYLVLNKKGDVPQETLSEALGKFLFFVERLGLEAFVLRHDPESLPLLVKALSLGIRRETVRRLLKQMGERAEEELLRALGDSSEAYSKDVLEILSEVGGKKTRSWLNRLSVHGDPMFRQEAQEFLKDVVRSPKRKELTIRCFGEFEVLRGDDRVIESEWKTRKTRSLLAYLLAHFDHPVSEEKLLDVFWPETDVEKARHALHTTIYRLRRALEPRLGKGSQSQYILHKGNFYYFNRDIPYWLDLEEFERQIKLGQIFESQGNTVEGVREHEKAKSIYRGDFLVGEEEGWCLPIREKYRRLYVRVLLSLIQVAIGQGSWDEVIGLADRILEHDPLHERAHQTLMQAFFTLGRRDEAIRQYHLCSDLLKKNLNILPSEETIKLYLSMQQA